jgi:hypothetical protein
LLLQLLEDARALILEDLLPIQVKADLNDLVSVVSQELSNGSLAPAKEQLYIQQLWMAMRTEINTALVNAFDAGLAGSQAYGNLLSIAEGRITSYAPARSAIDALVALLE